MQQQAQHKAGSFKMAAASQPKGTVTIIVDKTKTACVGLRDRTQTIVKNPEFQKLIISTASGTAVFGAAGGAFGGATGILLGSAAGLPTALFTFGLSIPVCATMGGAGGLACGTVIGGGTGAAAGFTTYKYRLEIKEGIVIVKVKAESAARTTHQCTKVRVFALRDQASNAVAAARMKSALAIHDTTAKVRAIGKAAVGKATEQASATLTFASSTRAGVTSTAALSGGVVGSTAGGGAGMLVGAAAGVVPAIFTFGLSIPVGAALGLFCGSAVGGSVGVVSGGALGYGGFTYRKELAGAKDKIGKDLGTARTQMTRSWAGTGGSDNEESHGAGASPHDFIRPFLVCQ